MAHVAVVGAGVVGLSAAWALQQRGWQVTVVDRDLEGDRASHGNAGCLAVGDCVPLSLAGLGLQPLRWLLDPLGPLAIRAGHAPKLWPWFQALRKASAPQEFERIGNALADLNRHALAAFDAMVRQIGIGQALHKAQGLTLYETQQGWERDQASWQFRAQRGVQFRQLTREEVQALEPGLAPVFERGVLFESWGHVDDPRQVVDQLRAHVAAQGGELVTGEAVRVQPQGPQGAAVHLADGRVVAADKVLVAAGAWSAQLAQSLGERALLESERGYNTTLPHSLGRIGREVMFAERMFVATPLAIGLRIGGTAEFAGLKAPPNYQRSAALLKLARRYFRDLDETDARQWMGHRPSTPDSLPVLGASTRSPAVFYAFGHGHLGLTQSAISAQLLAQAMSGEETSLDLAPFSIARFQR